MDESAKYGQMDFSLPHDVIKLPSQGIFYKPKKETIKVGFLTAQDENILMSQNNDKEGIIYSLLRQKIYEPGFNINDMLDCDVQAVLIFLRNTSFGPEYNITAVDPQTGKRFETEVLLDSLDFKVPSIKPNDDGTYSITLPKSGTNLKIRPLTYKELQDIEKLGETYPKGRVAPKITWKLMKQIVSVEGDSTEQTKSKFIEGLPIMDSKYIRNFLFENEPSIDLRKTLLAPSGEKVEVTITFGAEFFRVFF
jgi:hypothetical protein